MSASFLAFFLSLFMGSHLFLSSRGLLVPNERWSVLRLATLPPQMNADFGPFETSSFAGFHFVRWSGWYAGGRYVMIPKWVIVLLTGIVFVVVVRVCWRWAAR
jgi:hypothetical protein